MVDSESDGVPGPGTHSGTASDGGQVYQAARDLTVHAAPVMPRVGLVSWIAAVSIIGVAALAIALLPWPNSQPSTGGLRDNDPTAQTQASIMPTTSAREGGQPVGMTTPTRVQSALQSSPTCSDGKLRALGPAPMTVTEPEYEYVAEIRCPPDEGQAYYAVIEYPKSENGGYDNTLYFPQLKDADSVPLGGNYFHAGIADVVRSTRYIYIISCAPSEWAEWSGGMAPGESKKKKWPGIVVSNISSVSRK